MGRNQLSLITVSYNSATNLRTHWADFDPSRAEWIVVDNGSQDDSIEAARSLGARVIPLDTNEGFGSACNVGLANTNTDVVDFVNPDVNVIAADLDQLADQVRSRSALVAPQLLNEDGSLQPNGRGVPSLANKVANRLHPALAEKKGFRRYSQPGEAVDVEWLTGAAIFGLRTHFNMIHGFDEAFFLYYEDIDLCIRARQAGIECTVLGDYRWTHGWARATSGLDLRAWRMEMRSAARFYRKYPHLAFASPRRTSGKGQR